MPKLYTSKPMWAIAVVIVATVLAQFPGISEWIKEATEKNEHLVTIVEGILGVILLLFATSDTVKTGGVK